VGYSKVPGGRTAAFVIVALATAGAFVVADATSALPDVGLPFDAHPPEAALTVAAAPPPFTVPTSPEQWFHPSGGNDGTEGLVGYLANLALHDNAPLVISDGWGRTTGAATSDHHVSQTTSWANDLAVRGVQVPTATTELAAARIASALGEPGWTGGDLVKVVNGYRFQLLWKVDGHFNHVHIGVRHVG
jgi:hypothetical protein